MTTRLDLRTSLRRRLEDSGVTPLWDDAMLNDALAAAIRRYGARFPAERSATETALDGVTSIAFATPIQSAQIVRVLDPSGDAVPRQRRIDPDDFATGRQSWRWWAGSLRLTAGASGGTWTVEYHDARAVPADDLATVDVTPGDEEIVVLFAAVDALARRAVEDAKRGLGRGGDGIERAAARMFDSAERLIAARKRRVVGGVLQEA